MWDPFTLACTSSESFHLRKGRLISCGCFFFWFQIFFWAVRFFLLFTLTSKPDTSFVNLFDDCWRAHNQIQNTTWRTGFIGSSSYVVFTLMNFGPSPEKSWKRRSHDLQFLCFSFNYPTNPVSQSVSFERSWRSQELITYYGRSIALFWEF